MTWLDQFLQFGALAWAFGAALVILSPVGALIEWIINGRKYK